MTDEVSVDDFLFGRRIALSEPEPVAAVHSPEPSGLRVTTPNAAFSEPRQMTMTGPDEAVEVPLTAADFVVAVVLRSRSGSDRPHVVTILTFPDGDREVVCICEAILSVARRPAGCWAMTFVRGLVGIREPVEPGGPS